MGAAVPRAPRASCRVFRVVLQDLPLSAVLCLAAVEPLSFAGGKASSSPEQEKEIRKREQGGGKQRKENNNRTESRD
ncbi:hypothetical protein NDU88_002969 [Pleurodeles waltl]|uniref:Uncharacterized protein n=1 Tax=Pleurodeles waltl TaxID=8319 RepID=A0AAV7MR59_PLEWA|nr:hypothetical protein NDU88_002969 [Pleurodeles waltl]